MHQIHILWATEVSYERRKPNHGVGLGGSIGNVKVSTPLVCPLGGFLCAWGTGVDRIAPPPQPQDRTAVPPKTPTRLTAEQIATFVQVGAALSMLQYALLDPVQNVCGLLLLCYGQAPLQAPLPLTPRVGVPALLVLHSV